MNLFKKRNKKIHVEFYLSFLGGLFSGVGLGLFFTFFSITKSWKYNVGVSIVGIILLIVLYFIGKRIIKNLNGDFSYTLNFLAGTLSSLIASLLMMFKDNSFAIGVIVIISVIIYPLFMKIVLSTKKKQNK